MKILFQILISLLVLVSTAFADFQYGLVALNRDDYETALREFNQAAESGDVKAYNALGMMYLLGKGVYQDSQKGVDWYVRAAEQGHTDSQFILGQVYREGTGGIKIDHNLSMMWFLIADANGCKFAKLNMDFLSGKMTPDQIQQAEAMAKEWLAKHRK